MPINGTSIVKHWKTLEALCWLCYSALRLGTPRYWAAVRKEAAKEPLCPQRLEPPAHFEKISARQLSLPPSSKRKLY